MKKEKIKDKEFIKEITPPLLKVIDIIGKYNAGLLICMMADALNEYTKDDDRFLRTIEIKFNDFFSFIYDFEKCEEMVKEGDDYLKNNLMSLEIVNEKGGDVHSLKISKDLEDYNEWRLSEDEKLTEEEYNILNKTFK